MSSILASQKPASSDVKPSKPCHDAFFTSIIPVHNQETQVFQMVDRYHLSMSHSAHARTFTITFTSPSQSHHKKKSISQPHLHFLSHASSPKCSLTTSIIHQPSKILFSSSRPRLPCKRLHQPSHWPPIKALAWGRPAPCKRPDFLQTASSTYQPPTHDQKMILDSGWRFWE